MEADAPGTSAPQEDFEVFYAREFHRVVALAYGMCGSWSAAEDLAQDAFVAAQRRWSTIGGYDRPEAWVRRAVANRSVSLLRRRVSEARALLRLRRQRRVEPQSFENEDDEFWRAVRSLPTRQRQVIGMHYITDLSVSDIARTLEVSEATVKTHLQRGRRTLATEFSEGESTP